MTVEQLEFAREDVEGLSRLLEAWLAGSGSQATQQLQVQVEVYTVDLSDLLDLEALASAVAGLQDPLGQLRNFISNVLNVIGSRIIAAVTGALRAVASTITSILNTIASTVARLPSVIEVLGNTIRGVIERVEHAIVDKIMGLVETISAIPKAIQDAIGTLSNLFKKIVLDPLTNALKWLSEQIPKIREALSWVTKIPEMVGNIVAKIGSMITNAIKNVVGFISQIPDMLRRAIEIATGTLRRVIEGVTGFVSEVGRKIVEGFKWLIDQIARLPDTIGNIIAKIGKVIENALSGALKFLRDLPKLFQGFISELTKRFQGFVNWLGKTLAGIPKVLQQVLGYVSKLPKLISDLVGWLSKAFEQAGKLVSGLISQLSKLPQMLGGFLSKIVSGFTSFIKSMTSAFTGIQNLVRSTVSRIATVLDQQTRAIMKAFKVIIDIINRLQGNLVKMYEAIVNAVKKVLIEVERYIKPVVDILKNIPETVRKTAKQLAEAVEIVRKSIQSTLSAISDMLKHFARYVQDVVRDATNIIRENVTAIIRYVVEARKVLAEALEKLVDTLRKGIEKLLSLPFEIVKRIVEAGKDFIGRVIDFAKNIPRYAVEAIQNVQKWIWEHLPDWVKDFFTKAPDAIKQVGVAITGFINAILRFPEWFPQWFKEHIADPITNAIKDFAKWIWDNLPDPIRDFFEKVGDIVKKLYDSLMDFLKNPVESIAKALMGVWEKVVEAGEWFIDKIVKPTLSVLQKAGELIWSGMQWFLKSLAKALGDIMSGFVSAVSDVASSVARVFMDLLSTFVDIAKNVISGIASLAWQHIPKEFTELKVEAKFMNRLSPLIALAGPFTIPFAVYFNTLKTVLGVKGNPIPEAFANPVGAMYAILNATTAALVVGMLVAKVFKGLSKIFREASIAFGLQPAGIGARIGARIRLSEYLSEIGESVEKLLPDIVRYIMIGNMIWWAEPTRVFTRYLLTEWVTVELPPLEHGLEALRRHLVTPLAPSYYEEFVAQLRMGGIGKPLIDAYYPLPEELAKLYASIQAKFDEKTRSVVITDRFGQPRLFPASLVAAMPSPEKLATMMIRDIILDPKDFAAVMGMHGFTPDTAFMFYLLHYRYPSPEKLAEFFWRGIAGELWNPDKSYDKQIVETFFKEGQAPTPVAPKELNFQAENLFEMMKQYMKWHDYARFPWKSGWPTDNAIIMDLIADIPGKIDLRWMSRWGLFDYWGAYGVTVTTSIEKITRDLLKPGGVTKAEPMYNMYVKYLSGQKPVFDVRQYARTLQATGLHPYWVPWVTIAETINALTEERTLLRTGFINLFREGIWSLEDLNKLLAGFFTVIFRTAYFDPSEMKWKEVDVEYPVAFLPAESKLLELRAVMDKALDIYREAYRRIIRAVAYNVVSPDDAKKLLSAIMESMNESFFANEIQRISGKQYELKLDEGYWKAWTTYASVIQELEARERTRFYARYIIWSVLWGLRWGYTTPEEATEWLDKLVDLMHEHQIVKDTIKLSLDFMIERSQKELAVRAVVNLLRSRRMSAEEAVEKLKGLGFDEETAKKYIDANVIWYTPSITTYASMLEVVPEALKTVLDAVQHFNLPEDEQKYWMIYIMRQPVRDELTLVRTRIYQLLSLGMEPEELTKLLSDYSFSYRYERGTLAVEAGPKARELLAVYEKAVKVFRTYGISPHEWVLYNLIARMEELKDRFKEAVRERIPSPSTLAVLAEYLVLPEDLVEKTLKQYGVAKEWLPYWLKYIEVKPIKSDAKSLLSVYIRALRYGAVTEQQLRQYIAELVKYGFTPKEIDFIRRRVELEEAIEEARELRRAYLPTPTMLATLSEVVEIPPELVAQALARRRVPEEWYNLWLQYIARRPLYDDFRYMMNRYYRALRYGVKIPEDLQKKIQQYFDMFHVTAVERDLRNLAVTLDVLAEEARVYVPTPAQLATLAEYMVVPENLIDMVFKVRHVPPEWQPIWRQYIRLRPIKSDYKQLLTTYIRALRYDVVSEDEIKKFVEMLAQKGFTKEEIDVIWKRIELEELIASAREYLPTPMTLATLAEYLVLPVHLIKEVLARRRVPPEWINIWLRYIEVRPIKGDAKQLLTTMFRALRYGVVTPDELNKFIKGLVAYGFTPKEIDLLKKRAELEEAIIEARELRRSYLPTPYMLATLSEYVQVPVKLVKQVLEARRVPKEWIGLWLRFIQVRPLADEARLLATAYFRAKRYGVPLGDLEKTVLDILGKLGFTEQELKIRELRATIEAMIDQWREMQRAYIPTPSMLASIAEVVPEARQLLYQVLQKRRVPSEWVPVWTKYVQIKPIIDEVRGLLASVRRLYENFAIKTEEFRKWLESLKAWGYEDMEVQLILARSEAERALRAWRELIGTPRSLVAFAEYSPTARRMALSLVYRMIDALPTDQQTKEFLKKMWEEYVRVRPVYDEVRRYVTELISDYADGIIGRSELEEELKALKEWGLDDYEIQFYLWLAERRRQRYLARRLRR